MKILCLLLATANVLCACFIPPAEDVLLFRRDALKLDDNRQQILASNLVTLANRPDALIDSAQQRASAQLLALAASFAPDSKAPGNVAQSLLTRTDEEDFRPADLVGPLENISHTLLYLLEDPTKKEHFAVAQLILDPLVTVAPNLSIISARPNAEESSRWQGAVAPPASFVTPPPSSDPPEMPAQPTTPEETKPMPAETAEKPFPKVADFKGSLSVPLFLSTRNEDQLTEPQPTLATLTFDGKLTEGAGDILVPSGTNSDLLAQSLDTARRALRHNHGPRVLASMKGSFSFGKEIYRSRSGQLLALPMAILAEGLLSERKPLDNLIVLGDLKKDGTIEAPAISWQFLQILLANESDQPRRLLLAPQLKPLLLSILTERKEDFFFRFDIFEVATLEEAFALSFEEAAPEKTREAIAKFDEIRRVGANKSTSVFVSNAHVLARLAEVEEIEPRYLSASLLKIRGSGEQPQDHSTKQLATILQSSLMPLSRIPYTGPRNQKADSLEKIHEECRAELDVTARYVAMGDRELYDDALDLANRVRTLARAKTRLDAESFPTDDSFRQSLYFSTFKAIQEEYVNFATEIATILGQEPPIDPRHPDNKN